MPPEGVLTHCRTHQGFLDDLRARAHKGDYFHRHASVL
jgi:hypothetical protein